MVNLLLSSVCLKGISREPQFQSKKKVPVNPSQIPTSLQWGDRGILTRRQITKRPASPPAVDSVAQTGSVENVNTPLAPRTSKPTRASEATPVQEGCSSADISRASSDQQTKKQPAERVSTIHIS